MNATLPALDFTLCRGTLDGGQDDVIRKARRMIREGWTPIAVHVSGDLEPDEDARDDLKWLLVDLERMPEITLNRYLEPGRVVFEMRREMGR